MFVSVRFIVDGRREDGRKIVQVEEWNILKMGHDSSSLSGSKQQSVARYDRVNKRKKQKTTNEAALALLQLQRPPPTSNETEPPTKNQETQTDCEWDKTLKQLKEDNIKLREELRQKSSQSLNEETLQDDGEKLRFYPGGHSNMKVTYKCLLENENRGHSV